MFTVGLVAGLMIAVALVILCFFLSRSENWPKDEGSLDFKVFLVSTFKALPAIILPVFIVGGIYMGYQTPTESAATAVVYSLIVGVFIYREIRPRDIARIVIDSAKSSAMILLIFGTFLEGIATCVLLVPVLWPIAKNLGIDVIHFGMIVCISNVVGTMTPPVAVNIFAASSVTKLKMGRIAVGEIPFLIGYTSVFFLVVFVPWFSTFSLG
jgi:C4-dicarboxylate transporter DctM subunit